MDQNINKNRTFQENTPSENGYEPVPESMWDLVKEIAKFTVVAILIVAPIRFFIAQPFIVKGESMDPTFADGQYLIVDEITYRINEPERGDVIVFKYPKDPSKYFIKRIIGLPGETVTLMNGKPAITPADGGESFVLDENYILARSYDNSITKLKDGEYFAMGDNRNNSLDSRIWGPLPKEDIIGRALVRLFPINKIGLFPGK